MDRMKNKGITLIALVVTIVVLIILATISISLLINSNIIGKTTEANFKTVMAGYKEKVDLYVAGTVLGTATDGAKPAFNPDVTGINAGEVLKAAIKDKIVEDITVDNVTTELSTILPELSKKEEKYIVVYKGEMYYVSSPNVPNNAEQEKWCRDINIPILEYIPPTGIVVIDGSYEEVKGLYLCTPNIKDGFAEEKTRYLEMGSNGKLQPGRWTTHYPKDTWYDYKNRQWANVYIETEGIENYYTWIPRYCYKVIDGQRTDVKFINTDNSYKEVVEGKDEPVTKTWDQLSKEGYIIPDAFQFGTTPISGYWVSKYTLGEVSATATIKYEMAAVGKSITIDQIKINTEITKSNPIVKYTVALNGNVVQTIDKASEVNNIAKQTIHFTGLRAGNNTINLTGLNAAGEVVGSMTKEYELSVPNAPDLSGFDEASTFYIEYDAKGEKIVDTSKQIKKDGSNAPETWYDYPKSKWANVIVRNGGSETYYTWIPRYEYRISTEYQTPAAKPTARTDVKFIETTKTTASAGYTIPDAFNFGGKPLSGYWVSKYTLGEVTAPVFTTETAATNTTITTKGVTGTGVTSGLTYHYYLNGVEQKDKATTTAANKVTFTGLTAGTEYTIMVYVTNSNGYVGSYTKKVTTALANAPDLSGFNENNTYYVVYNEDGTTIKNQKTKIKKDLSNAPTDWYDYSKSKWANIVVLGNGTTTYYTWIPRYEYKILPEQALDKTKSRTEVRFIPKTTTTASTGYTIPDAFKFGTTQLSGYWVSKYTVGTNTYTIP